MELGVGGRVRMVEPTRELDRRRRPLHRPVWEAEQPQAERRRRQAGHARVVAQPRADGARWAGFEQADGRVEVSKPADEVAGEDVRRAHDQVTIDPHARIVLTLSEGQDPFAELASLGEIRPEQVEAREPAQDREVLAELAPTLEQLERPRVGLDGLRGEAAGRQQRPGETHPKGDLLSDELGRRRRLREDRQQIRRQLDGVVIPGARLVQDEEAVGELREFAQVRRAGPVAPGEAKVLDLGRQHDHRLVARGPGKVSTQPRGEVGVIGRMGAADRWTRRTLVEPLGRVLPDRLEHQQARFTVGHVDLSDEALLEQGRERLDHVDVDPGLLVRRGDDGLDRRKVRVGEDGKRLEQALLTRFEELITPVDRRPKRLLALRRVARRAAQQLEPTAEPVAQRLGGEQPQARRGELDRQRQAVEPTTDVAHRCRVVVVELEFGTDRPGSIDEQLDRLVPLELLG